jgi:protein phosphatase
VALRIVDRAAVTDVGMQRQANEDSLVVQEPFFAVADGMGGAKAGEVASKIATDAFGSASIESAQTAEAELTRIARDANRRIFEQAEADSALRGMGTTLTAAVVHGHEVSLGHVGDSRAYLLRDGKLEQLTRDHSLVAELERSGQLTREAAEHHPQRSIITRALGPEPDVEVDTYTVAGRPGDVFLLCSDGLTGMVPDEEVGAILRRGKGLETAAKELVRAANQSGGKDNITTVLFELGEAEEGADPAAAAGETMVGEVHADDVRAAAAAEQPSPEQPAAPTPAAPPADRTVAAPPPSVRQPTPTPPPTPRRRGRSRRRIVLGLAALLVVGAVAGGLYALSRQVYFVGTNDAGLVTLYRGVPYDLPLGIELYDAEYESGVPARAIPTGRRDRVLDHEWRGHDDAVDLVRTLEQGQLEGSSR